MISQYNEKYFSSGRDVDSSSVLNHHHGAMKVLSEIFKGNKINRLLDIGCGTGGFSAALLSSSNFVTGIDISGYAIRTAKLRYKKKKRLNFFVCNITSAKLPFPANTFDAIICLHVLEHIDPSKLQPVLKEFQRILKKGGRLISAVPNCGATYRGMILGDTRLGRNDPSHRNFFTPKTFYEKIKMQFPQSKVFTYPPPGLWIFSYRLSRLLSFDFGNNIFAVGIK